MIGNVALETGVTLDLVTLNEHTFQVQMYQSRQFSK